MLLKLFALISAGVSAGICALVGGFSDFGWIWLLPVGFLGAYLVCLVTAFLFAWIPCKIAGPDKVYDKEVPYLRTLARLYAPAVFTLLRTKIQITGKEKLPKEGRFLLVCNHRHNLDSGVMLAAFPDSQLAFLAKKETRQMFLIGNLMGGIQCQFLDRENDRAALKTILKCISILKEDTASMVAFPEGGVIKDGKVLHHFRNGVFKIAQKAGVPIVVCTIRGAEDILRNFKKCKPSFVDLRLLEVIPAQELKGVTTADIGHRVYNIMAADLGAEPIAIE